MELTATVECVHPWLRRNPDGSFELRAHHTQYLLLMSWPDFTEAEARSKDGDLELTMPRPIRFRIVLDTTLPEPSFTGAL